MLAGLNACLQDSVIETDKTTIINLRWRVFGIIGLDWIGLDWITAYIVFDTNRTLDFIATHQLNEMQATYSVLDSNIHVTFNKILGA